MKLGYYYHINYNIRNGRIYLPEYAGRFVDELAKNVESIVLMGFVTNVSENCDYILTSTNVELLSFGKKRNFVHLLIFGGFLLRKFRKEIAGCDRILIRAPSPLAPAFSFNFSNRCELVYLFVGDYSVGVKFQTNPFIRQKIINFMTLIYETLQNKAVAKSVCLTNSPVLAEKYKRYCQYVGNVKTTVLKSSDIIFRDDSCNCEKIKLLFVGRIEKAKGVFDLLEGFNYLSGINFNLELHLVGWDTSEKFEFEARCNQSPFKNNIVCHGYKSGIELNRLYSSSDIFVLPSYHEGFPRVVWEAMARGLPVVISDVGAISDYLSNYRDAFIFQPGQVIGLVEMLELCISNSELRMSVIENAYKLVEKMTLEYQTSQLMDTTDELFRSKNNKLNN